MHDTHILKNLLRYLDEEQKRSSRRIKKIYISLSEFGGMDSGHFREHFQYGASGTSWESLDMEIKKIPYGPELEITKVEFV